MKMPFSDISPNAVRHPFKQAFHSLGDASRAAVLIGIPEHSVELVKLCEVAMSLTLAAKGMMDGRLEDVDNTIKAALEELSEVQARLDKQ